MQNIWLLKRCTWWWISELLQQGDIEGCTRDVCPFHFQIAMPLFSTRIKWAGLRFVILWGASITPQYWEVCAWVEAASSHLNVENQCMTLFHFHQWQSCRWRLHTGSLQANTRFTSTLLLWMWSRLSWVHPTTLVWPEAAWLCLAHSQLRHR